MSISFQFYAKLKFILESDAHSNRNMQEHNEAKKPTRGVNI